MNQKKTFLILLIVFAAVLVAAGLLYSRLSSGMETQQLAIRGETVTVPSDGAATPTNAADSAETTEPVLQLAPDFTVYDGAGKAYKLSDFRGKPVVLNFWASWCGPCKSEMPDFDAKAAELADQVQFLMVNLTDGSHETVETASAFITQQGYTFPVYFDSDQSAAYAYGVYAIPTTYFIDAEGYAVAYASGAISAELLQTGIDMIFTP